MTTKFYHDLFTGPQGMVVYFIFKCACAQIFFAEKNRLENWERTENQNEWESTWRCTCV